MAKTDDILDELYIARAILQDLYIPLLRRFPPASRQRDDFLRIKGAVDAAIVDLENRVLGSIAERMQAAQPDVKEATRRLKGSLRDLKKVQGTARKLAKVLGHLEKAIGLFV